MKKWKSVLFSCPRSPSLFGNLISRIEHSVEQRTIGSYFSFLDCFIFSLKGKSKIEFSPKCLGLCTTEPEASRWLGLPCANRERCRARWARLSSTSPWPIHLCCEKCNMLSWTLRIFSASIFVYSSPPWWSHWDQITQQNCEWYNKLGQHQLVLQMI